MFDMDVILGMQSLRFEPLRGTRVHAPAGIHKGKCKTGQYASTRYGIGKDMIYGILFCIVCLEFITLHTMFTVSLNVNLKER